MKLQYLNQLSEKELKSIGSKLGFQFYTQSYRKGFGISVKDDYVEFSSWDENYSSSKDYDYNTLRINDFQIIGLDLKFQFNMKKQENFEKIMEEMFVKTNYKKDREKFYDLQKQEKINEYKQKINEYQKKISELENKKTTNKKDHGFGR